MQRPVKRLSLTTVVPAAVIPLVYKLSLHPIDPSAHRSLSFSTILGITLLLLVPLWKYDKKPELSGTIQVFWRRIQIIMN